MTPARAGGELLELLTSPILVRITIRVPIKATSKVPIRVTSSWAHGSREQFLGEHDLVAWNRWQGTTAEYVIAHQN